MSISFSDGELLDEAFGNVVLVLEGEGRRLWKPGCYSSPRPSMILDEVFSPARVDS